MNEQQSSAEIIANHQVIRLRGGYIVRTLDGLREIGTFSRRVQAEMAAHVAAAFAAAEQERLDELSAAND
jgi:hypothetical protein